MKTIQIHHFGKSDKLIYEDVEKPKLAEGEILVRIRDAAVNPIDYKLREGYAPEKKLPYIVGSDFAGEIFEIAGHQGEFKVGDRVFGFTNGSYAEFAKVKPSDMALIPAGVALDIAAGLPTAGVTAWQLVVDETRVSEGQRVLIHGAAGGVGSIAVQLCKWKKAHVIANAAGEDRKYLQGLGINEFVDYQTERFDEKLGPVDVVIDLVGGETYRRSFKIIKPKGVIATTVHAQGGERDDVRVFRSIMRRSNEALVGLADLVERGYLKIKVEATLPLEKAREAQDLVQNKHKQGKVILNVA